jgi:nucleotide-binding universal stress UspA family protein
LNTRREEGQLYNKILAPLDGSELAECTLRHIKAIATGCNVPKVVLLRIIEPVPPFAELAASNVRLATQVEQDIERANTTEAKQYVKKKADKLKKEGVSATGVTISGKPDEEILKYADKNRFDLIIMSTHGRSGISRWAFGSVADRVSHYSTIPVLIVSPRGCRMAKA